MPFKTPAPMQLFTIPIYPHKIKSSATPHLHNQISTARQRTPESLSHVHEQPVFMGCLHTVPFGNCDCPAPFLILLRKGGCALLLHFLTPLNSKCSGAASTSSSTTRQQLQKSALPSAERHQQTQPLTLTFSLPPYTARSAAARFLRRRCRSRSAVCRP